MVSAKLRRDVGQLNFWQYADWAQFCIKFIIVIMRALPQRDNAMKNSTLGFDQTGVEILAFKVSDEALENAAGTAKEKANFTLGACTGLSVCDG